MMVAGLIRVLALLVFFQAGGVADAFLGTRFSKSYLNVAASKGRHPDSASPMHPGSWSSVRGRPYSPAPDCCPCEDPEDPDRPVELNCQKSITKFEERAVVEDEAQFYADLDGRLQVEHCDPQHLMECVGQPFDETFDAVKSYIEQRCNNDESDAGALMQLVTDYCSSHSADDAVKMAFDCTLGCRLADHLNQVCHNMKLVPMCPAGFGLSEAATCLTRISTGILTFNQAAGVCENIGGRLPQIDTADENAAASDLAQGETFWIGLTDVATEGTFLWEGTSDSLTYSDWVVGGDPESSGNGMDSDCVVVFSSAGWTVVSCDDTAAATTVCQTSLELVLDHP